MRATLTDPSPLRRTFAADRALLIGCGLLLVAAIGCGLFGCAGLPKHADGLVLSPTSEAVQEHGEVTVPYYLAGKQVFTAEPAGELPAGEPSPLWELIALVAAAAIPGWNVLKSVVTASGKSNWAVLFDSIGKGGKWGAFLHNTVGTSSPPEAIGKRVEAEPAVAEAAKDSEPAINPKRSMT